MVYDWLQGMLHNGNLVCCFWLKEKKIVMIDNDKMEKNGNVG